WAVMRMPNREDRVIINYLEDALVVALHLNAFIRHARSVRLANFTSMMTAIGINYPKLACLDKMVLLNTIFYPFELYSRTCGQLALDVFHSGDTFSGTYLGRTYNGIRTWMSLRRWMNSTSSWSFMLSTRARTKRWKPIFR